VFSALKVLGKNFRERRRFNNIYEALQAGPYIPKSDNVADLAQSRIYSGRAMMNKRLFLEATKNIKDPSTKASVATSATPVDVSEDTVDPKTGQTVTVKRTKYVSPSTTRTLIATHPSGLTPPVAVLRGYERVFNDVLGESQVPYMPGGAEAL